jgi:hypothetical protein
MSLRLGKRRRLRGASLRSRRWAVGEVLADAFDLDAEHGGEVLFVAQQQIDLADQFAVDFLRLGLAADGLPEESR